MNTTFLILGALILALLLARATCDLIEYIYRRGYRKGREDAVDDWLGFGERSEEMQKEIRYEEEQN